MRVLGSAIIPVVFMPEDCVRSVLVRIVNALPYGFILGAHFFRANRSVLDFEHLKGFKPTPSSPWVPYSWIGAQANCVTVSHGRDSVL